MQLEVAFGSLEHFEIVLSDLLHGIVIHFKDGVVFIPVAQIGQRIIFNQVQMLVLWVEGQCLAVANIDLWTELSGFGNFNVLE